MPNIYESQKNIKLICKQVRFYTAMDEDIFFDWIKRISSIVQIQGAGDEIHLFIKKDAMETDDVENILSLFRRYFIDTKQLKIFLTDENKEWLAKWVQ